MSGDWLTFLGGTGGLIALLATLVVGMVGIVVSIRSAQRKRTIDWFPLGTAKIITEPLAKISVGLALTYNGEPLPNPSLCRIRVENTGRETIRKNHFQGPLRLTFLKAVCYEAVVSRVSYQSNQKVGQGLIRTPQSVVSLTLKPFNRGDWLQIDMVLDGDEGYPAVALMFDDASRPVSNGLTWLIRGRRIRRVSLALAAATAFLASMFIANANHWAAGNTPGWFDVVRLLLVVTAGAATTAVVRAGKDVEVPAPKVGELPKERWTPRQIRDYFIALFRNE